MKTILITTAIVTAMTTAAVADNFDNNTYDVSVTSGVLDFTIDANKNGITDFGVGATGFAHNLGAADAGVRGSLSYNLDSDTIGLRGEYALNWIVSAKTSVYGTAAVEYITTESNLGNGDFFFDPSAGVQYQVSDKLAVFGEVGYAWNIDSDWSRAGGYVELGAPFAVNDTVTITPSLVRGIDDGEEETNLNVSVALSF